MTQLFEKRGRRYIPWGNAETGYRTGADTMRVGTFRLVYCPEPGLSRYQHDVTPDTAAFMAAAEIARFAMEERLREASRFTPSLHSQALTEEQQAVVEECRKMMERAGVLTPIMWLSASPHEVAQAGIDAVMEVAP